MPLRSRKSSSSDDEAKPAKAADGLFHGDEGQPFDDWFFNFVQDRLTPKGLRRVADPRNAGGVCECFQMHGPGGNYDHPSGPYPVDI